MPASNRKVAFSGAFGCIATRRLKGVAVNTHLRLVNVFSVLAGFVGVIVFKAAVFAVAGVAGCIQVQVPTQGERKHAQTDAWEKCPHKRLGGLESRPGPPKRNER
eukprot:1175807-Prorocentrum_minimum.AAC.3